jgi:glycosyltransferase involved in cell wall biosynthesis
MFSVFRKSLRERIRPWPKKIGVSSSELNSQVFLLEHFLTNSIAPALRDIEALREQFNLSFQKLNGQVARLENLLTNSIAPALADSPATNKLSNPAVSVIMPTYNRRVCIAEAVRSVQNQSLEAWELAIVDDGSSDDTPQVLKEFENDPRIKYISQPHLGVAAARNRGIRETSARLIAYLDTDNTWFPNFLSFAVRHLSTHPEQDSAYGALVTHLHNLDQTCILWKPFCRRELLNGNYIDANVFVHRRELVSRFGDWDEALVRLTDWDLILRYTQHAPAYALGILGARYGKRDENRITDKEPIEFSDQWIRNKWLHETTRAGASKRFS